MSPAGEPDPIVVVLSGPIGLGTVDALARLQLAVQELGGRVCLRAAPDELVELLILAGLGDVFGEEGELGHGVRQAEEREEPLGVEEEADP